MSEFEKNSPKAEKENSSLISRQAAINAFDGELEVTGEENAIAVVNYLNAVRERIMCLPSAEPERKKGKWVPHRERSREYIGTALVSIRYDYWFCDTCGYRVEDGQPMYNFCPNCGTDMRGENE